MTLYSVIIPVYNSENIVEKTVLKTMEFFQSHQLSFEIILVNDASKDGSWEKIRSLAQQHSHIIAIDLLKNYGQHSAVFCGIHHAKGDYLITMDDDLQNPPKEIIHLINKIQEGYDLVFGKFPVKQHRFYRRWGSKLIGYLNYKIFNKPKEITLTNFRIFTREVADRVKSYKTFYPYTPGLLLLFSSKMANVPTEHWPRTVGKSNYSIFVILKLVGRLLFNYSSYPLKMLTIMGVVVSLVSFLIGIFVLVKSIVLGIKVQGWTTLVILSSFLNGFIIVMLGVLGEYVARIIKELSISSAYQVREIVRDDEKK